VSTKNRQKTEANEAPLAAAPGSADIPHEGIWRCTADDDPEKYWDSTTALDALIDAEEAIASGALKVVIQRISPPNLKACSDQNIIPSHQ
jgi:hypothetical protein